MLIFINSMAGGGAERVTASLTSQWVERGWDVTVVTLAPRSDDFYELHPSVNRIALDLAGDSRNVLVGLRENWLRVFALRRVLREFKPNIALGVMSRANVLLALASLRLSGIRTIGSERTYPPQLPLGIQWEYLRRICYGRLFAVTALTSETEEWLKARTGARRIQTIPNAALWPLPVQAPQISPGSLYRPGRLILLAVGRTSEEKQFGMLLEVFNSLAGDNPKWDLVILGEGPQRRELQTEVLARGLQNRVFLPGRVGNVGEWYEQADLYVLSSRFEGFPNTLVEAMAYGLPSVSFDCNTGPRDIIRNEVDGLLVSPGDVTNLRVALCRLMEDASLRNRLAQRAMEVRERFAMSRILGMWEDLFDMTEKSRKQN
jgi:glycosyltransferase involved in cell wall biosynthesis